MKYPAILKNGPSSVHRHQVVIAYSDNLALHIEGLFKGKLAKHYDTRNTVNITQEYLANTYGEVLSPEHAEFIIELAELHGFKFIGSKSDITTAKSFMIYNKEIDVYPVNFSSLSNVGCRKKIKIPLPPKSNTNTPEEDFEMQQIQKNNGDNLMFGGADKCKEWPCVGDKVQTSFGKGVIKLLPDIKGCYVILIDGVYFQLKLDEIKKPLTPEKELRDELINVMDNSTTAFVYAEHMAKYLIEKYPEIKKPQ